MKKLITDMAEKMYSDIYVKRYKPFMSLLTVFKSQRMYQNLLYWQKLALVVKLMMN